MDSVWFFNQKAACTWILVSFEEKNPIIDFTETQWLHNWMYKHIFRNKGQSWQNV